MVTKQSYQAGGLKLIHPLLNKIPITKKEDKVGQRSAQNCYNYVNVSLAIAGTSRSYFSQAQIRPSTSAVPTDQHG